MPSSDIRNHLKRFFFLLAFSAAIGSSARAQQVVTTPTGSKLEVSVNPTSHRNHLGEPIEIAVTYRFLKPEGGSAEKPWKQDVFPVMPGNVSLSLFSPAGSLLPRCENQSPSVYYYETGPDTFTRIFILPEWAKPNEPGAYRIRVETEFTTDGSESKRYNNDPERSSMFSVIGEEKLDILPPDSNHLGQLINEIGPLALKTDYNREWDRILLIEDRQAAPFLAQWLVKVADIPGSYRPTSNYGNVSPKTPPTGYIREVHLFHFTNLVVGGLQPSVVPVADIPDRNEGEMVYHPLSPRTEEVIDRLTRFGGDHALQAFVAAAKSRYYDVREQIARHLPDLKNPKAFSALAAMRKDRFSFIRKLVAQGLGADSSPETESALQELLKDRVKSVRDAARQSLEARKSANPK